MTSPIREGTKQRFLILFEKLWRQNLPPPSSCRSTSMHASVSLIALLRLQARAHGSIGARGDSVWRSAPSRLGHRAHVFCKWEALFNVTQVCLWSFVKKRASSIVYTANWRKRRKVPRCRRRRRRTKTTQLSVATANRLFAYTRHISSRANKQKKKSEVVAPVYFEQGCGNLRQKPLWREFRKSVSRYIQLD